MRNKNRLWMCLAVLSTVSVSVAQQTATHFPASRSSQPQITNALGRLPLRFEPNQGQTSSEAKFMVRGRGYSAFLTAGGMVLSLRSHETTVASAARTKNTTVLMNLMGAAQNPRIEGEDLQPGHLNYFIGKDPKRWRTNVPIYGKVRYKNVYPGIDLVYYGNHQHLEYDFEVASGGNPSRIQFEVKGASNIEIDAEGNLLLKDKGNEIHFQNPVVYQVINGERVAVNGGYVLNDSTHVGFHLAQYDASKPLVIDPVLVYCTYLGGSLDDEPQAIAIDGTGAIYVTGDTLSTDFPGTSLGGPTGDDVFVAKLDPTGATLVYADYFGGSGASIGNALAVDSSNNVYVTGNTGAPDFPTTATPYQPSFAGNTDVFVTEIAANGSSLLYSTYLGGSDSDVPVGVAVDSTGEVYVAGWTASTNFPVLNAFQGSASPNGGGQYGMYGFLTKFASDRTLAYSTYFGGSATVVQDCSGTPCWTNPVSYITGLALDGSGNPYLAGITNTSDFPVTGSAYLGSYSNAQNMPVGFVSKFDSSGSIGYSTYLYGSGGSETDITAIAVDSLGSAYVTGATISDGTFPITSITICDPTVSGLGCNYAFVTKFDPTGTTLAYSTFLGLNNLFAPSGIALDSLNDAYVLGVTYTGSFATVNGIQSFQNGGSDLLIVEIDPLATTQLFATYFGGATAGAYPAGIAVDGSGDIFVGGVTSATDLPTLSAYQAASNGGDDAFLFEIGPGLTPALSPSPGFMQYASQPIGQNSQPQPMLLRNMGSVPLTISSITATGDFTQTNDCGVTVAEAGSCNVQVTFAPSAPGTRSGSIVIEDSAVGSPHVINLQGNAMGPMVGLNAASFSFPSLPVGTSGGAQTLNVSNSGNAALNISNVQVAGDFKQSNNCPGSLASGASCQFQIAFMPTATGVRNGSLTLTDDAFNNSQSIALTGTGVDFSLTSSKQSDAVTAGSLAKYVLTLTPMGGSFSSAIQLNCSGAPVNSTCSLNQNSVIPGQNATSVTLTISTTAPTTASSAAHSRRNIGYMAWIPLQGIGLFGVVLVSLKKRTRRIGAMAFLPLVLAILVFSSACGGGVGHISPPAKGGTAPGSYNIVVTGTSGSLQHSLPLVLSVQ